MKLFVQFAVLLHLTLVSQAFAKPRRLDTRILEPSDDDLRLNDRGELVGELYDERGTLRRNSRIDLQSRQNPSFNFGGSSTYGRRSKVRY